MASAKKRAVKRPALKADSAQVNSIMTRRVRSVRPGTSLEAAMDLLMARDISHLPVVEEGALVGILSKTDVVRERFIQGMTEEADVGTARLERGFHEEAEGLRVSDVMSSRLRTVTPTTSVAEASLVMAKNRVHGLPVVDEQGYLVGFVSTLDVARWVAQAAG